MTSTTTIEVRFAASRTGLQGGSLARAAILVWLRMKRRSDWCNTSDCPHPTSTFLVDPEVAGAFAVGISSSAEERVAKVCVLDVPRAMEDGSGQIVELEGLPWCERARRQAAFGYAPIPFRDLKSPGALDRCGLWWFEMAVRKADIECYRNKFLELLDTATDPVSGLRCATGIGRCGG